MIRPRKERPDLTGRLAILALLLLLLAALAALPAASQTNPSTLSSPDTLAPEENALAAPRVRVYPSSDAGPAVLHQGQAFLVRVDDPGTIIASLRARWDNQSIPCFPDPDRGRWLGLGGVARDQPARDYDLNVTIETTDGRKITARTSFRVERTVFDQAELTVAPAMAKVPASAQAQVNEDHRAFRQTWSKPNYGRLWDGPFERPVPGRVTSTFGEQRVFNGSVQSTHSGVDFAGAEGSPILALAAGRVAMVRSCYIEGNTVVIDHGAGIFTVYCHLSAFKVEPGQMVVKGDVIGLVGATGRVTGPHLHLGVRVQGVKVDATSLFELEPWLSNPGQTGTSPSGGQGG